ncbi:hypothetical protein GCM10011391_29010 [Pullulanibacillus camelliae]|uniref:SCP2 domain-containing protein n=1 Tax=Pullulanibacillus camelliae TaxID=1707096 RepID=A0A8J3DZG7_9BACL|nr:SCP2 sterol-binding domain-containing protein [Pullulanibacillus camelliae]GGE48408.1 hypothetical protein GCM10011391_29010 [Pullulanibacillus camelliae]
MLIEASKEFVDVLAKKTVFEPLYKKRNIVVALKCENEETWIAFHEGQCSILTEKPDTVDVQVAGKATSLRALMDGSERLMLLEAEGRLELNGHLQDLLALESLFLLTGKHSTLFKH